MVSPPLPMTRPTLLEATMTHSTLSPGPADGHPAPPPHAPPHSSKREFLRARLLL